MLSTEKSDYEKKLSTEKSDSDKKLSTEMSDSRTSLWGEKEECLGFGLSTMIDSAKFNMSMKPE